MRLRLWWQKLVTALGASAIGQRRGTPARFRRVVVEAFESRALLSQVILTPTADNSMFQESPTFSSGAGEFLYAGQAGHHLDHSLVRRALLKFNVVSSIPAGSVIDSVSLTLNVSNVVSAATQSFGIHRVLADWGEGASDSGNPGDQGIAAAAGDATWRHRFFGTALWSSEGGDFAAAASSAVSIGNLGAYSWTGGSSSAMAADVQAWLENPAAQFGWIIKQTNEAQNLTAKSFYSKESIAAIFRRKLTINYSL